MKVSEVPPGPPVLQTLVAEVYGPDYPRQIQIAREIRDLFEKTEGVVDVDWYVEDDQTKFVFEVNREKAALNGISAEQIAVTLRIAVEGMKVGLLHVPKEKEDVPIFLRLPKSERSSVQDLKALKVMGNKGNLVPLGELVSIREEIADKSIYHKNLMPVVYVTGDVAGSEESPVYAIMKMNKALDQMKLPEGYTLERFVATQPGSLERFSMKWNGEWYITYEVFRDLGLAFAAVLVLIYILVVGWFQSFKTPVTIMAAIPFSLVGILPAHALMGAFFTATSMILHYPGGFHRTPAQARNAFSGSCGGCRCRSFPPHDAYRSSRRGRRRGDPLRSDLPGPRAFPHGGGSRFSFPFPHDSAGALLLERAKEKAPCPVTLWVFSLFEEHRS